MAIVLKRYKPPVKNTSQGNTSPIFLQKSRSTGTAGKPNTVPPTATELELGMSLPEDLRNLPVGDIRSRSSRNRGGRGGGGGLSTPESPGSPIVTVTTPSSSATKKIKSILRRRKKPLSALNLLGTVKNSLRDEMLKKDYERLDFKVFGGLLPKGVRPGKQTSLGVGVTRGGKVKILSKQEIENKQTSPIVNTKDIYKNIRNSTFSKIQTEINSGRDIVTFNSLVKKKIDPVKTKFDKNVKLEKLANAGFGGAAVRNYKRQRQRNPFYGLSQKEVNTLVGYGALYKGSSFILDNKAFLDYLGLVVSRKKPVKQAFKETISAVKKLPRAMQKYAIKTTTLLRTSPYEGVAILGSDYILFQLGNKGLTKAEKLSEPQVAKLINKIDPKGRGVKVTEFGEQYIEKVPGLKKGRLEFIPPRGAKLNTEPLRAVKKYNIPLSDRPKLPKLNKRASSVINIVKEEGDIIGGSLAQKTLLKKGFARKPKDIDIYSKNPEKLARIIQRRLKNKVRLKKLTVGYGKNKFNIVSVVDKKTGKKIADIDPISKVEEGFINQFKKNTIKVKGIKFLNPQVRLASKVKQLERGKIKSKVLKDIKLLTGKKVDLNKPSIRGAYGYTKAEMKKLIGKRGALATSQVDFLGAGWFRNNKTKINRLFYATPFNPKTKIASTRITRLGVGVSEKEAGLLDLIDGQATLTSKNKPQVYILPKEKIYPKSAKGKGFRLNLVSSELEVVLDKGFILKRGKRLASTVINGKRVPVYQLKKFKLDKELLAKYNMIKRDAKFLKKFYTQDKLKQSINNKNIKLKPKVKLNKTNQRLTKTRLKRLKSNINKLDNSLKRKTGLDYNLSSRKIKPSKRFRIAPRVISLASRTLRQPSKVSRPGRGITRFTRAAKVSRPGRGITRFTRITRKGKVTRVPPRALGKPTPSIIPRLSENRRGAFKKLKKAYAYAIFEKRGKRFVKLKSRPLTLQDAKDRLAYRVDNKLSRSIKIKGIGKVRGLGSITPKEKGYFNKAKYKLRQYKIQRGKRIPFKSISFIEKRKYGLDKYGERQQAKLNKRLRSNSKTPKRILSPSNRKILLKRLEKARAVRMANLRRKR